MKIGIDCRIYSSRFTGIGRYSYELVKHITHLNASLSDPHELVLFFNEPEYSLFDEKAHPHTKKVLANAKHYSLAEQIHFLRVLNREKLDLMHFTHFNVPVFYRRPFVVTIHDLTLSFFPGKKMNKWYHRQAYNLTLHSALSKSQSIIAVSHNTGSDIAKLYPLINSEKIKVIHNGVSSEFKFIDTPEVFGPTLNKYGINKPFLLYTGVWRNHKNLPNLLKAFAILKNSFGLDLQLVLTGKEDPYYPEVRQTIGNLALEKSVVLPGLVSEEELLHLYNAALIYTFPSYYEGFGLSVLESMACGTPVACSSTSSLPEVCGEDNAVLFDPANVQDIADKIYGLYTDADLQAKLVARGIHRAKEFSWEAAAKETFDQLQKHV